MERADLVIRQPGLYGSVKSRGGGETGLVELVNLFFRWIHLLIEILFITVIFVRLLVGTQSAPCRSAN